MPAGCLASLEAVPTAGWLQIMVLICMQEAGTGFASKPQTDDAEAGDIALDEEETPVVCVRVCLSLKAEARAARRGGKIVTSPGQTTAPLLNAKPRDGRTNARRDTKTAMALKAPGQMP